MADTKNLVALGVDITFTGTNAQETKVYTSSDSGQWESVATLPVDVDDIAYGNGSFVAVGKADEDAAQTGGVIYNSADAVTWSDPISVPNELTDVVYDGTQWIALGAAATKDPNTINGVLYFSVDGKIWQDSDFSVDGVADTLDLEPRTLAVGGGTWIITYRADESSSGYNTVVRSDDGKTWTPMKQSEDQDYYYGKQFWAWNGEQWGVLGIPITSKDQSGDLPSALAVIGDAASLPDTPVEVEGLDPSFMNWLADGRWITIGFDYEIGDSVTATTALHASADLEHWVTLPAPAENTLFKDVALRG